MDSVSVGGRQRGDDDPMLVANDAFYTICTICLAPRLIALEAASLSARSIPVDWASMAMAITIYILASVVDGKISFCLIGPSFLLRPRTRRPLSAVTTAGYFMADILDLPRKSVLVLGASGFIGSRLVATLSGTPTYRPIAASRRPGRGFIETRAFDATRTDGMQAALRDADYVVNCIAGSGRTMIAATQALCDAARANPPRRIVHLSSMAVYGAATGSVREDHAAIAPLSDYGEAKLTCERIMLKYVHDGGDAIILRPTCVFGPGSMQWTTRIGHLLQTRRIGDLGPAGDGYCNLVYIDDLVVGVIHALGIPWCSNRKFNVSTEMGLTWNQFLVRFAKTLGATPVKRIPQRNLRLESRLLAPARRITDIGLRRFGVRTTLAEAITPSLLALMGQDIRIDSSAAINVLSLPQTPAEHMIASAAGWLKGETPPATSSRAWMETISS